MGAKKAQTEGLRLKRSLGAYLHLGCIQRSRASGMDLTVVNDIQHETQLLSFKIFLIVAQHLNSVKTQIGGVEKAGGILFGCRRSGSFAYTVNNEAVG